jgi:hypothetical protein
MIHHKLDNTEVISSCVGKSLKKDSSAKAQAKAELIKGDGWIAKFFLTINTGLIQPAPP